jgi:DegV family protein with EDD domain
MSKVIVVTDSTTYIPEELKNKFPLETVPLVVIWGAEQYLDGVDITPNQFYTRLQSAETMPSTSQTTPNTFKLMYEKLLTDGFDIISMHISSKLSGTMDSAIQAKAILKSDRIEIIDSETTGMALGFQALTVARAAANGATLKDCVKLAHKAKEQTGILFAVQTLEFLHRGGRIGGAAAFLGTMLNLKPILELREGRIEAAGKVRTMNKAIDKTVEMMKEKINGNTPIRIAVQHANSYEEAQKLLDKIIRSLPENSISESLIAEVSPVIGTHLGPGAIGISFMYGM